MTPEEDDIQQALESVNAAENTSDGHNASSLTDTPLADTLAQPGTKAPHIWNTLRLGAIRAGLMAEKYPWQTTAALLVTIGCGWVCSYFGLTVFAALLLYAATADDSL